MLCLDDMRRQVASYVGGLLLAAGAHGTLVENVEEMDVDSAKKDQTYCTLALQQEQQLLPP